jgi:1,4-alpha-glucan branching enzyme
MNPRTRRQSYRAITKTIVFRLDAPKAREVVLVIRLAKDDTLMARPLRKSIDGIWNLRTELARGRYVYRFLVDGTPTLDASSMGSVTDAHGDQWSTREIGY